jgi:hypothetical protein
VTAIMPPGLADTFEVHCYRCGKPADRVEDEAGLQRLLSPRSMPATAVGHDGCGGPAGSGRDLLGQRGGFGGAAPAVRQARATAARRAAL